MPVRFSHRLVGRLSIVSVTAVVLIYGATRLTAKDVTASTTIFPDPVVDGAILALREQTNAPNHQEQIAVFAGGCFWGMEGVFEHLKGVSQVFTGYAGGSADSARYGEVNAGITDHAESVKIIYDPSKISYEQLLKVYFAVAHDPTQLNRQGPDIGTQYRSEIFFVNNEQKQIAQSYIDQLNQAHVFSQPIVTQLSPLQQFYAAEDYHQDFVARHPYDPYVVLHELPKIAQLKEKFPALYQ